MIDEILYGVFGVQLNFSVTQPFESLLLPLAFTCRQVGDCGIRREGGSREIGQNGGGC